MLNKSFVYLAWVAVLAAGCVDHRPIRNGLTDDSIYLEKTSLTAPNPKTEDPTDDGWLFKVTVAEASSPNPVGDYAFPGLESSLAYVRFRFREDKLQVLDGRKLQIDREDNPNDDLATSTDRVIFEFDGRHVDVQLRENLDGERTNFVEENTEKSWQDREYFKVDFEKMSADPVQGIAWFYGDFLAECAELKSMHIVPDSYQWEPEDQYMSWLLEANYDVTVSGGCYDMVTLSSGTGTATIRYRLSFYRPGPSDYQPEVIEEKAGVNKKYGAFQILQMFRDSETGLLGAKSLLQRWNPAREEPVVFYFHKGFPERFKPMFQDIAERTNKVLADAGAKLRFDFREYNDGGVERHLGDIRYSFVTWHHDIDTTMGLLGYGPSSSDPRTGEVISANLNLYNVGMDYYRFMIQDYLEELGATKAPDGTPWEQTECEPGTSVAPPDAGGRLRTTLFEAMRKVMDLDTEVTEDTDLRAQLLPEPSLGWDAFLAEYHRLLPELRYVEPRYNDFVYRTTGGMDVAEYKSRLASERAFRAQLDDIIMNENPFDGLALHTREGIQAQLDFHRDFRRWREDVRKLQVQREMLLGLRNVYTVSTADALTAASQSARLCKADGHYESDAEYSERIIEGVVYNVAIHEFGHNLGLRHNFYGSVDAKHMEEGAVSSSVMDYVRSQYEASSPRGWGGYDRAALSWIYGSQSTRDGVMQEDFLFCTDQHRMRSALCYAHDLGITPSQIVLNHIEGYDLTYKYRNKRAYRKFWDLSSYTGRVYAQIFPLLRMYYLGIFDFAGGNVQETLKRLDQLGGGTVRTDDEYDEIAMDFGKEARASIMLITAFFDAIVNQSAAFRNYATEFDPYYGDPLRMGIIFDKLAATVAFMDLHDVANYNPNVQTYVSIYDSPYGAEHEALSKRVLDNMLGANYDTFEWFKYYALLIFAEVSNDNVFDTTALRDRIAIRRFNSAERLMEEFGPDVLDTALAPGNYAQLFEHEGEQYIYAAIPERGWHVVANRSRNPVSFKYIRDYNESLNQLADDDLDSYGLKVMLAYYEYFNNLSGY